MTTANDLCHTVAKYSFPYSFNSDKNQELNDEDITESDIFMFDQSVVLETAINFPVTKEDLERINLHVAVAEATRFPITKGDLTRIDQSVLLLRVTTVPDTEEHRTKMAMNVDLASNSSIDCSVDVYNEPTDWKELREKHNMYIRNRD